MEKIDLNNISLSYETKGKGSDVLLLHGFPSNMYMWNEIKNELIENGYRVTIIEQRGYPLSRLENFDVHSFNIEELSKDIEELIKITEKHQKFGFYIAKKLYQEYVSLEDPDQKLLHQIVQKFRKHSFNISEMLRVILSTKRFWDEDNKLTLVKSPIDLLIGTMRNLGHLGINSINHKSWDKFLNRNLIQK